MGQSLRVIANLISEGASPASIPWNSLRNEHVQAIRSKLSEIYAPSTANRHLSALRGVLNSAWRLGLLDAETLKRTIDVRPVGGSSIDAAEKGRNLSSGEIDAIVRCCYADSGPSGVRDAALFAVAYTCGLRRSEIVALTWGDYADQRLLIRRGKGNKARVMPLHKTTMSLIEDWSEVYGLWHKLEDTAPMFVSVFRSGKLSAKPLSPSAVYHILSERSECAGVAFFSPHDLRRTFAGNLLDAGADLSVVQKLMGHATPATTVRYDKRDGRARRDAVDRLHIPARKAGAS
jgi:integrase